MKLNIFFRSILARIEITTSGYFAQLGWFRSRATKMAIDAEGQSIPWFTYPAIQFLEERVACDWSVLEFGSGMGTIWWSRRTAEVTSVEHSPEWARRIASRCEATVVTTSGTTAEDYLNGVHLGGGYHIVIVDGLYRNECLTIAPTLVCSKGIIILDDAQREEYRSSIDRLRCLGYRTLPLHGPQPVSKHPGCTMIFYRDENVLGL